ncbi:MAG: hypothetical protein KA165_19405 [Saprospiraceae bacterium]|nr:hypothetical protein [Saprospiraceae bacterium]
MEKHVRWKSVLAIHVRRKSLPARARSGDVPTVASPERTSGVRERDICSLPQGA